MKDPEEKGDEPQEEKGYPDEYVDLIIELDEADPDGWWSN